MGRQHTRPCRGRPARRSKRAFSAAALALSLMAGNTGADAATALAPASGWNEYLRQLAAALQRWIGSAPAPTPAPAPAPAPSPAPSPQGSVSLAWVAPASTSVSGTVRLTLRGQGLRNVEVFQGGTMVARAQVSGNSAEAVVDLDTTRWPSGSVTLTAHAWNSAPGTPYTGEADAGPLVLQVSNGGGPQQAAVDITSFGAVCDGSRDNSAAIAAAIDEAKRRSVAVFVPAGVCAYGDIIRLDSARLVGSGDQSVLYALDTERESIFIYGNGSEVRQLKLSGRRPTVRRANWETSRIALFGASNFVIDSVTVDTSANAGFMTAQGAHHGRITNNRLSNTLSDSIHLTDNASYITVEGNHIENSGDDGIAVVSYQQDGGMVHHITARNNVIRNNKWGRLMSVVGGSDVLYENNYMENNLANLACLYIAQEGAPWHTFGAHDVIARRNTLKNCGGSNTGHGAVMLYSDGAQANTNVSLVANDIQQNGQAGIRIFGSANSGISVEGNRVEGANPATDITAPAVNFVPYVSGPVGYATP